MKRIGTIAATAFLAAGITLTAGCLAPGYGGYRQDRRQSGYPPYAPNSGYRYDYQGANMRYEAPLGVYVVVGRPDIYFHRDRYVRWSDGRWESCDRLDGRWSAYDGRDLPDGLVRRYRSEARRGDGPGYNSPPPQAPAHGYRLNRDGVDLTYDAPRGVYVVPGRTNTYFYNDRYIRQQNGRWEAGSRLDGSWARIEERELPPSFTKRDKKDNEEPQGRGRGNGNQPTSPYRGRGVMMYD